MSLTLHLLLAVLFVSPSSRAADELDPASVDWKRVTSKLRWLNFYEANTSLTVYAGKTPCLKAVRYARHYAPTPFPAGSYAGRVVDERDGKEVATFPLTIKTGRQQCLVTTGNPGSGAACMMLIESPAGKDQKVSRVTVYNTLAGAGVVWKPGDGHPGDPQPVEAGASHTLEFMAARGYEASLAPSTADGAAEDAQAKAVFKAPPAAHGTNFIVFAHRDEIRMDGLRLTVLKEGEAGLLESGGEDGGNDDDRDDQEGGNEDE